MTHRYRVVDVFSGVPFGGNPVAVVLDGEGIDDRAMQTLARWTNLSETTFVLPPSDDDADYRVRIFTPASELPFAGHPTLGTCHAWLEGGGVPRQDDLVIQECEAGLIRIRRSEAGLAFAAPPLLRSGRVDGELVDRIAGMLAIARADIIDSQWVDNGPGWVAVLLRDADAVLSLKPGEVELMVGVVGAYPPGHDLAFEVRAFFPVAGATVEDPVTGSLNASLAGWLLRTGRASAPYVASQGGAIGRCGRVHVSADPDGTIWVGGETVAWVAGALELEDGDGR